MAKKSDKDAIRDQIIDTPTWPDDRVAAAVNEAGHDDVTRAEVSDVRLSMGAKHTWKGKQS